MTNKCLVLLHIAKLFVTTQKCFAIVQSTVSDLLQFNFWSSPKDLDLHKTFLDLQKDKSLDSQFLPLLLLCSTQRIKILSKYALPSPNYFLPIFYVCFDFLPIFLVFSYSFMFHFLKFTNQVIRYAGMKIFQVTLFSKNLQIDLVLVYQIIVKQKRFKKIAWIPFHHLQLQ